MNISSEASKGFSILELEISSSDKKLIGVSASDFYWNTGFITSKSSCSMSIFNMLKSINYANFAINNGDSFVLEHLN